jgi:hypothetical protein
LDELRRKVMSKVLVAFYWDCGRMGSVDGLFVTTPEELDAAYGKQVYFGEILGKHSEVYGDLQPKDITVKSDDPAFIDKLVEIIGSDNISGYNPLDYIEGDEDEDEEDEEEYEEE